MDKPTWETLSLDDSAGEDNENEEQEDTGSGIEASSPRPALQRTSISHVKRIRDSIGAESADSAGRPLKRQKHGFGEERMMQKSAQSSVSAPPRKPIIHESAQAGPSSGPKSLNKSVSNITGSTSRSNTRDSRAGSVSRDVGPARSGLSSSASMSNSASSKSSLHEMSSPPVRPRFQVARKTAGGAKPRRLPSPDVISISSDSSDSEEDHGEKVEVSASKQSISAPPRVLSAWTKFADRLKVNDARKSSVTAAGPSQLASSQRKSPHAGTRPLSGASGIATILTKQEGKKRASPTDLPSAIEEAGKHNAQKYNFRPTVHPPKLSSSAGRSKETAIALSDSESDAPSASAPPKLPSRNPQLTAHRNAPSPVPPERDTSPDHRMTSPRIPATRDAPSPLPTGRVTSIGHRMASPQLTVGRDAPSPVPLERDTSDDGRMASPQPSASPPPETPLSAISPQIPAAIPPLPRRSGVPLARNVTTTAIVPSIPASPVRRHSMHTLVETTAVPPITRIADSAPLRGPSTPPISIRKVVDTEMLQYTPVSSTKAKASSPGALPHGVAEAAVALPTAPSAVAPPEANESTQLAATRSAAKGSSPVTVARGAAEPAAALPTAPPAVADPHASASKQSVANKAKSRQKTATTTKAVKPVTYILDDEGDLVTEASEDDGIEVISDGDDSEDDEGEDDDEDEDEGEESGIQTVPSSSNRTEHIAHLKAQLAIEQARAREAEGNVADDEDDGSEVSRSPSPLSESTPAEGDLGRLFILGSEDEDNVISPVLAAGPSTSSPVEEVPPGSANGGQTADDADSDDGMEVDALLAPPSRGVTQEIDDVAEVLGSQTLKTSSPSEGGQSPRAESPSSSSHQPSAPEVVSEVPPLNTDDDWDIYGSDDELAADAPAPTTTSTSRVPSAGLDSSDASDSDDPLASVPPELPPPATDFLTPGLTRSGSASASSLYSLPRTPEPYQGPPPMTSAGKSYGGIKISSFDTYRAEYVPEVWYTEDLQDDTVADRINRTSDHVRSNREHMQFMFSSVIRDNTREDEPKAPEISIINEVDHEPVPEWDFYYTNRIYHGNGVPPPSVKTLLKCDCVGKCDPKNSKCPCVQRQTEWYQAYGRPAGFAYEKNGRLKINGENFPMFECNDLCGCDSDCSNRVVQHGRKVPLSIKKTLNKGWGIFAGPKKIPRGTFLGIYAGELLRSRESEERGLVYNKTTKTYLFDIDFWFLRDSNKADLIKYNLIESGPQKKSRKGKVSAKQNRIIQSDSESDKDSQVDSESIDDERMYTMDAYHAGNFTRFLNHSCEPNCRPLPCYINEDSLDKPLMAVFAIQDINPYEEICFNYNGRYPGEDDDDDEDVAKIPENMRDSIYVPCKCGAKTCRKIMFK